MKPARRATSASKKKAAARAVPAPPGDEMYRALIENTSFVISVVESDGTIRYVSPGADLVLGYRPADLQGSNVFALIHPEDEGRVRAEFAARLAQPGARLSIHCRLRGQDGTWRHVDAFGANHTETAGLRAHVLTFRDVTERQRAETLQGAILRIAEAAAMAPSLHDLLAAVHAIVGLMMPARSFYVALYDPQTDLITFPYHVDEKDPPPPPRRPAKGLTEYVLRTRQPLLAVPELFPELERRGEVELRGTDSVDWLGVPLTAGDRTIGVLAVQTYEPGVRYTEREQAILQYVSTQLAAAIERKRAEAQLRLLAQAVKSTGENISITDLDGHFTFANRAFLEGYGFAENEVIGHSVAIIDSPRNPPALQHEIREATARGGWSGELWNRRKDGSEICIALRTSQVMDPEGRVIGLMGVWVDITERTRLEDQLRQAQKMEAVGQLAGGVAHDFNNLLTAILGFASLLLDGEQLPEPLRPDVEEIRDAAQRAASLTQQLLAFSRKQVLSPVVLDLNQVVRDIETMLRRLIGEHLRFVSRLGASVGRVRADRVQVEQVVINLAVNARDAMREGGTLTIETAGAELTETAALGIPGARPGQYVVLAVSDTGVGMDAATQARIFEPFFTTKETGAGTGLGLATVYGIVQQSGGFVTVSSEVGRGSTFRIYLPLVARTSGSDRRRLEVAPGRGQETILIVEDEPAVRALAHKSLEQFGYVVLAAEAGPQALLLAQRQPGPIDLLFTDVVMPGMSGRELAERLTAVRPLKVLYTSGYTDGEIVHHGVLDDGVAYLAKPYTPDQLAHKVREVLDSQTA